MSDTENDETIDSVQPALASVLRNDVDARLKLAPRLRNYKVNGILGHGGMGMVWRAEQISTHRGVALKVMSAASFGSERARLRFEREVELTAKLDHPNIARVYDSGTEAGVCYYALELVESATRLDQFVKNQELDERAAIALMQRVCEAVQHAHQKGIIHRDLKHGNILVSPDGRPKVLDFGLAKAMESDSALSVDGEVSGTPAYMSPEQASGHGERADTRSDVYSLGVILYNVLTGGHPHDLSGSQLEVMKRVAEHEIIPPREVKPDLNADLVSILSKSLARDPDERYASAGALGDDLESYLLGDPVAARASAGTLYYLRKRVRKYRGRIFAAAAIVALLLGAALWSYASVTRQRNHALAAEGLERAARQQANHQAQIAEQRTAEAVAARTDALRQADIARREAYFGTIGLADAMMRQGDYQRARDLLASCPADLRHWEWRHLSGIAREETYPIRLPEPAVGICFSSCSDLLAIATSHELSIWDFNDLPPQRMAVNEAEDEITALAFDPGGARIATAHKSGTIRVWDPYQLELISSTHVSADVTSMVLLPDDGGFALLTAAGQVVVQRNSNGKPESRTLDTRGDSVISLAMSRDGKQLAGGCQSQKLRVWDLAGGTMRVHQRLQTWLAQPVAVAFLHGGQSIAYATAFDIVGVRDRSNGQAEWSHGMPGTHTSGLALSDDGSRLAVAYSRGIALFDPGAGGAQVRLLQVSDRGAARCPALSRAGRLAAGVFDQRTVRVWALDGTRRIDLSKDVSTCFAVASHPTSGRWAYGQSGRHGVIVDADGTRRPLSARHAPDSGVVCTMAWSRSGDRVAWAVDKGVAVYDAETGSAVAEFDTPASSASHLTFADADRVLISGAWNGTIQAWDIKSGALLWQTTDNIGSTESLASCPIDDKEFLVERHGEGLTLRRARDGQVLRFLGAPCPQFALTFSSDGHVLYGNDHKALVAMEWPSGRIIWQRNDPDAGYWPVAVSADGRRLAERHSDRTVHVWDCAQGRDLITLSGSPSDISSVAWSPNDSAVIAADQGANVSGLVFWRGDNDQGAEPVTVDALSLCAPSDGILGKWTRNAGSLVGSASGDLVLASPIDLRGSYQMDVEAIRHSPNGSIGLLLPIGDHRQCDVEVAGYFSDGYLTGLDQIDGLVMRQRSASCIQGLKITSEQPVHLHVEVQKSDPTLTDQSVKIVATFDGREIVNWTGPVSRLGTHGGFRTPTANTPALIGYGGAWEFDKFEIKATAGDYEILGQPLTAAADHVVVGPGSVTDLLTLARPDLAVDGNWSTANLRPLLKATGLRARVPFSIYPRGSYELSAVFTRHAGDAFGFLLPHPAGHVLAIFDTPKKPGGTERVTGLSMIDDKGLFDTEYSGQSLGAVLETGRKHTAIARVEIRPDASVKITVRLDGRELYSWEGPAQLLSVYPVWKIDQVRWPAVVANKDTPIEFEKLEMKILDGDATVYHQPAATTTQPSTQPDTQPVSIGP